MNFEIPEATRLAQQPFSLGGTRHRGVGILCVHGFTGSPAEMRPLGQYLADQGFAVEGPVLPKHGGLPHELKGATWRDWVGAARDALHALSQRGEHTFIAGLSMGGLIALHLAAHENSHEHATLRGIIVMAAPLAVNDPRTKLVRFARYFVPYFYPLKGMNFNDPAVRANLQERMGDANASVNWDDPSVQKAIVQNVRIPLSAIHELLELNQLAMRDLPHVTLPALLMQGRQDTVVAPGSADAIAARVGSKDKCVRWYENSGHALPLEPDAPRMFEDIRQFIHAHLPSSLT